MSAAIRKLEIFKSGGRDTIHPQTQVAAIVDIAAALDSYKETFIDPELETKIEKVNGVGPDSSGNVTVKTFEYYKQADGDVSAAQIYSSSHTGVLVYVVAE